ncbi:hypothetical protein H8E52_02215 [bacterium]|nr:hypothetical protein [bacterium]
MIRKILSQDRDDLLDGFLLVSFMLSLPFYTFASGMPQPADLAMLTLLGRLSISQARARRFPSGLREHGAPLALFVLYSWALTLVWTLRLGEVRMLVYPLFYSYNLAVFGGSLLLFLRRGDRFLRVAMHAAAATLILQVLLSPLAIQAEALRQSLFLNGPNQLGYFAILAGTIFVLGDARRPVHPAYLILVFATAAYLAALSLSKSSMLALAMLIVITGLRRPWLLAATGAAALAIFFLSDSQTLLGKVGERLFSIGSDFDDSLAGRGYDRLLCHPAQMFLGAGEGAFWRFESFIMGEVHSSFGTLLFAYGLPGLILFAIFLGRVYQSAGLTSFMLTLPILFYGLTHQGLRFRLLWVLLAFLAAGDGKGDRE